MMRDIARNRKLAEISRAQHNEIVVLKQELERLRKKTFPALVKITRWYYFYTHKYIFL